MNTADSSASSDSSNDIAALIASVRENSPGAFEKLAAIYRPLTESLAVRFSGTPASDTDDCRQEAMLALYNAALTYDGFERDVSFGLYAKICITNALLSRKRQESSRCRTISSTDDETFQGIPSGDPGAADDPSGRVIAEESGKLLYDIIKKELSGFESSVLSLHLLGYKRAEIAARLGKNASSVGNALTRIKLKIRKIL